MNYTETSNIVLITKDKRKKTTNFTTYKTRFTEKDILTNAQSIGHEPRDCEVYVLDNLDDGQIAAVAKNDPEMFLVLRSFNNGTIPVFHKLSDKKVESYIEKSKRLIDMSLPTDIVFKKKRNKIQQPLISRTSSLGNMA